MSCHRSLHLGNARFLAPLAHSHTRCPPRIYAGIPSNILYSSRRVTLKRTSRRLGPNRLSAGSKPHSPSSMFAYPQSSVLSRADRGSTITGTGPYSSYGSVYIRYVRGPHTSCTQSATRMRELARAHANAHTHTRTRTRTKARVHKRSAHTESSVRCPPSFLPDYVFMAAMVERVAHVAETNTPGLTQRQPWGG